MTDVSNTEQLNPTNLTTQFPSCPTCKAGRIAHEGDCEFCPTYACGSYYRCPDHGPVNGHGEVRCKTTNPAPLNLHPDDAKVWDRAVADERARIERIIEAQGFRHDRGTDWLHRDTVLAAIRGGDDA